MSQTIRWEMFAAALILGACGGGAAGTSSSGTTTGGIFFTTNGGSASSGGSTTSSSGTSGTTTSGSSTSGTGSSSTSSGTSTSAGSSGSTSAGTSGTTTTSGTSSGGNGGTTGTSPPYQGYDAGPRPIVPIDVDSGCCAPAPFNLPSVFNFGVCGNNSSHCVQCRTTGDCPSGLKCSQNNECVPCRGSGDCAVGSVCQTSSFSDNEGNFHPAGCVQDCRTADPTFCNPGLCDTDAGGCLPDQCTANAQCVVDGRGACNLGFPNFNGFFDCVPCTQDAGGCGPDGLCVTQFGQNSCQLSCLVDGGSCQPGTFCGDGGLCMTGCQSADDCAGSGLGSICHDGQCVQCLGAANCPASNPGCGMGPFSNTAQCGFCGTASDCPASLHCEPNDQFGANQCLCHDDNECDPFRAPVCIGLNVGLGFPQGSGHCGCVTSADCPSQTVCETRQPYGVSDSSGRVIGGACIPSCNTIDTNCATAGITVVANFFNSCSSPPPNDVCDTSTGYCVPCASDQDCQSGVEPKSAPACAPFVGGANPFAADVVTGGGVCGCTDTTQCDDGRACSNPGINGQCQQPCSYVDAVDSCSGSARFCPSFARTPYCNTFTGGCQGCLSDHDCIGTANSPGFGNLVPTPLCDPVATSCVQCTADNQCAVYAPNCTQGFCGFCNSNADCPTTGGWQCINTFGSNQCGVLCVPDAQELPTGSCPSGLPFCANIRACPFCPRLSVCAQCRPDFPNDCPAGLSCNFNGVCQ